MAKRIAAALLALALCLALPTAAGAAIDPIDPGSGVTCTLDKAGTLTVSGVGDMPDYTSSYDFPSGTLTTDAPWYGSRELIKAVVVRYGVTSIGNHAFLDCPNLKSVTISGSVTRVGDFAFSGCTALTSVAIPDSVTNIGDNAFAYCRGLTSVTIGSGVTEIGDCAFESCSSLEEVAIPAGVTDIGSCAFTHCDALTSILVAPGNESYRSVGGALFDGAGTTLLQCPGGYTGTYTITGRVTHVAEHAFEFCGSLTGVRIPSSVTDVGSYAFNGCDALHTVWYGGLLTGWRTVRIASDNDCLTDPKTTINCNGITANSIKPLVRGENERDVLATVRLTPGTLLTTAVCAVYDGGGRLLSAETVALPEGEFFFRYTPEPDDGTLVRVFVLDSSHAPLFPPAELAIPAGPPAE